MTKPYWSQEFNCYCVEAFGEVHKFGNDKKAAEDYSKEVNSFWMEDYNYLQEENDVLDIIREA